MSEHLVTKLQEIHSWDEVPQFQSETEEAEFWDTHSLGEDFFQATPEIKEILRLIQNLMNRLVDSLFEIQELGRFQSDIAAENLLRLLRRNVEGILHLAACELRLLPSALIISRSLLETLGNLLWLIDSENPVDRENRFLALLNKEQSELDRYIRNLTDLQENTSVFEDDKKLLQEYFEEVKKRLYRDYTKINQPNFSDLLASINRKNLYPPYCRLSQSVHASHAATWIYKRERDESRKSGEWIEPSDWYTPLFICYYVLLISGQIFLMRFGGNPNEFITEEMNQEIEKALEKLKI